MNSQEIYFSVGKCSLGLILVAQSPKGICAVMFGDNPGDLSLNLQERFPHATLLEDKTKLEKTAAEVIRAMEFPTRALDLPLDLRGTDFQREVWQALRKISAGSTASYTDIAIKMGRPKAVRAVAGACAANALAVIIPCHRVVKSDGGLSGYRWGVERKKKLLEMEGAR